MRRLRTLLDNRAISRLENRALLSHVTGFNHAKLISYDNYELQPEQYDSYRGFVERLTNGEPLAYVLGHKEFYSRNFKVTKDTLIPRPETELLVETAMNLAPKSGLLLDLGTGSGVIAITCKLELADLKVVAVDKYEDALIVAEENAHNLSADVEFKLSDWYSSIKSKEKFDMIVSNPPYIEKDDIHLANLTYEPNTALTDFGDGLACIREIIANANQYLSDSGWLLLEHGYNQALAVSELFKANDFEQVTTIKDYAGLERITFGQKVKK